MSKFKLMPGVGPVWEPDKPISPLVDWIVSTSALDRTGVDNMVRGHRHYALVERAVDGDMTARAFLMKAIAKMLGVHTFDDAETESEILDAARRNTERPMDEAKEVAGKALVETVQYRKGHRNSKGEAAPWVIVSCQTGKVLSSHKSKEKAEEHLKQMEYYKHAKTESIDNVETALKEAGI